jgi:hypothetical protein
MPENTDNKTSQSDNQTIAYKERLNSWAISLVNFLIRNGKLLLASAAVLMPMAICGTFLKKYQMLPTWLFLIVNAKKLQFKVQANGINPCF